ncbi:hypothetical protein KC361_g159 [Hortaea werneckii]|nr:hypothetical protein KC361_g159 [Hortaea werneckii]
MARTGRLRSFLRTRPIIPISHKDRHSARTDSDFELAKRKAEIASRATLRRSERYLKRMVDLAGDPSILFSNRARRKILTQLLSDALSLVQKIVTALEDRYCPLISERKAHNEWVAEPNTLKRLEPLAHDFYVVEEFELKISTSSEQAGHDEARTCVVTSVTVTVASVVEVTVIWVPRTGIVLYGLSCKDEADLNSHLREMVASGVVVVVL